VKFQPVGITGAMEISDCKRYTVTRVYGRETWESWLQASDGPNTRLSRFPVDKDTARKCCADHERSQTSNTQGSQAHVINR
jgi:hypothetical protein